MKYISKYLVVGCLAFSLSIGQFGTAMASWRSEGGEWFWIKNDGAKAVNIRQLDVDGNLYSLGADGKMQLGWQLIENQWYYFNNVPTGLTGNPLGKPFGAALTGWQWIDGKCYYFQPQPGADYGKMFANSKTPDSYQVNANGQWVDGNGTIYTAASKGISSFGAYLEKSVNKGGPSGKTGGGGGSSSGGGGGGGGGSSSGGGGGSSTNSKSKAIAEVIKNFKETYIKEGMSDFEKEMMIIMYMVENIEYDFENYDNNSIPSDSYSAYGALVKGRAVCNGYALAFSQMAKACGLEVKFVTGTADGYSGWEGHAWNQVRLDGKWYNIDLTWEDPVPTNDYGFEDLRNTYINVTDEELRKDHKWSGGIPCTSKDYEGIIIEYYLMTGNVDTEMKGDKWRRFLLYERPNIINYKFHLDQYGYRFDDGSNYFESTSDKDKILKCIDSFIKEGYREYYLVTPVADGLDWINEELMRTMYGGDEYGWTVFSYQLSSSDGEYLCHISYNDKNGSNPLLTEEESRTLLAQKTEAGKKNVINSKNQAKEYMSEQITQGNTQMTVVYEGLKEICTAKNYKSDFYEQLSSVEKTSDQTVSVDGKPYVICTYQFTHMTLEELLKDYIEPDKSNIFESDGEHIFEYLKGKKDVEEGICFAIYVNGTYPDSYPKNYSAELKAFLESTGKKTECVSWYIAGGEVEFEGNTYVVFGYVWSFLSDFSLKAGIASPSEAEKATSSDAERIFPR